jgi:anhydro-N-acetylmuramic acid kinase
MDAIDAALVRITDDVFDVIVYHQYPFAEDVHTHVRNLTIETDASEIAKYDRLLGELFADASQNILLDAGITGDQITAIGSHGQTILHLPDADPPRTLQIGDPKIIAARTGITTVADFRRNDMEVGGQGAPLAPGLHAEMFRTPIVNRCILNLGGIANITVLPADTRLAVTGFDTGPANCLLDDWNQLHNKTPMDKDGKWARRGVPDADLLRQLLADPYFQKPVPKSTGRDHFNLRWLNRHLGALGRTPIAENVQATLLQLTISSIADAVRNQGTPIAELYLCGGGVHNPALVRGLSAELSDIRIASTEGLGMNPDAVEAVTFAWLAKRRLEGKPGNVPSVTGARKSVLLGTVYQPDRG